jgi:hypothetical protein
VNAQLGRGLSESRAFSSAWTALKRQGWEKSPSGRWRKVAKTQFQRRVDFVKVNEDRRLVFGWFSEIEKDDEVVVDLEDQYITEADLESAAYNFVLEARVGGRQHARKSKAVQIGRLVESMMFTKEKQELLGIDLGRVGWWGGFYIDDDGTWDDVLSKKFVSFSIGGSGNVLEEE